MSDCLFRRTRTRPQLAVCCDVPTEAIERYLEALLM